MILFIASLATGLIAIATLPSCAINVTNIEPEEVVIEEPKFSVQIFITCEKNLMFSKYDVDVSVDDEEIGNVEHGSDSTFEAKLTKGQHELVFEKEGHISPDGRTSFVVEGDGDKFSYIIHCTKDQIEIESISEEPDSQKTDVQLVSYDGISIEVPSAWSVTDAEAGKYVYPDYGGTVYLSSTDNHPTELTADEVYAEIMKGVMQSGQVATSGQVEKSTIGDAVSYKDEITFQMEDEHYMGEAQYILTEEKIYTLMFAIPDSCYDQHANDILDVFKSIKIDDPTAPLVEIEPKLEEPLESEDKTVNSAENVIFEYCYVKHPSIKTEYSYDLYYLFDEDTHFAVNFTSDSPTDIAVWPYRGDFNDGVEMDLIDGGEVVTHWYAHWAVKDSQDKLIIVDNDGFETELEACEESEVRRFITETLLEKIGL